MSMVTATAWVPRGYPAQFPTRYDFNEDEFERIAALANLQLDDARAGLDKAQEDANKNERPEEPPSDAREASPALASTIAAGHDLKEYNLDKYDDSDESNEGVPMGMFGNIKSLAYHDNDADDPYITLKEDDEDNDEREELQILATDNLLLAAKVEDEVAHLEVYVYEDEADNLYVHHDIMLPAIPLCLEWLDIPVGRDDADVGSKANFVAVGTFDPDIEIWDLDLVDCMYPNAILGQGNKAGDATALKSSSKKKRKKSKKTNDNYHVDAVLSLAANRSHKNLLASSSADKTVKLWDLNAGKCAKSYAHHTDKVCSLAWHPTTSTVLLSGSYDRTVVAADMRAPGAQAPRWGVESDVENVRWNPHDPNFFYISTESGVLHYHDVRMIPSTPATTKPVWRLQAHEDAISSFDVNSTIPGLIVTGSSDKTVKLWNMQAQGPSMVVSRNLDVGKVFSTTFAPDQEVGFRLAVAGSKGAVQIWDTSTNPAVRRAFVDRIRHSDREVPERLVAVNESSESEEDSDGAPEAAGGGWESMDEA